MFHLHNPMTTSPVSTKIFIIGIDGGTWEVFQPMMHRGLLPTLSCLMQEGAWGTLTSTVPHISPVAWASFMTGQNPAQHRILDFTYRLPGGTVPLPVNATRLQSKTMWQWLGEMSKQVGVINVPVTFPPPPVNGFLVSGFPMPKGSGNYTYPLDLGQELEAHGWHLDDVATDIPSQDRRDEFLVGLYRREKERIQATLWLMQNRPWDVLMVHLFESDRIQHELLNEWVRWQAKTADSTTAHYAQELEKFFQQLDQDVAYLLQGLETTAPGCSVIIMSDHGFGPTYKSAHVYNFLRQTHFLHLQQTPRHRLKWLLHRAGVTPFNIFRRLPSAVSRQLLSSSDVTRFEKVSAQTPAKNGLAKQAAHLLSRTARSLVMTAQDIDWQRTRAYCAGNSGLVQIFVNLCGREPHGIVPVEQYEQTCHELVAALLAWRDPADGSPVVKHAFRRQEIYHGPYLAEAADIVAVLRGDSEYYAYNGPMFLSNTAVEPDYKGRANHKLNGLFILKDGRVQPGHHPAAAHITDLAPTLFYLLGLPVPNSMDGRILLDCFDPAWAAAHPPQHWHDQQPNADSAVSAALSAQEEAKMMEMLQALGYVEA